MSATFNGFGGLSESKATKALNYINCFWAVVLVRLVFLNHSHSLSDGQALALDVMAAGSLGLSFVARKGKRTPLLICIVLVASVLTLSLEHLAKGLLS